MDSLASGYVIWQGKSRIDGKPIVAIVTIKSDNRKTGDMAQVWILRQDVDPVLAVKLGLDVSICGRCMFRKANGGVCYVNVGQAPLGVWRAYRRGIYPTLSARDYRRLFAGRSVRIGAYGDPMAVPVSVWSRVTSHADSWTGYTHQWSYMPGASEYQAYVVASCDSVAMARAAQSGGWSTFRVRRDGDPLTAGEKPCPAELGHVQCKGCPRKCDGSSAGQRFTAITVHGVSASKF